VGRGLDCVHEPSATAAADDLADGGNGRSGGGHGDSLRHGPTDGGPGGLRRDTNGHTPIAGIMPRPWRMVDGPEGYADAQEALRERVGNGAAATLTYRASSAARRRSAFAALPFPALSCSSARMRNASASCCFISGSHRVRSLARHLVMR